jgi:hypothetical protein
MFDARALNSVVLRRAIQEWNTSRIRGQVTTEVFHRELGNCWALDGRLYRLRKTQFRQASLQKNTRSEFLYSFQPFDRQPYGKEGRERWGVRASEHVIEAVARSATVPLDALPK